MEKRIKLGEAEINFLCDSEAKLLTTFELMEAVTRAWIFIKIIEERRR